MDYQNLKQLVLVLSLVALAITPSCFSVTESILNAICSQTQSQEFCLELLLSDPRTKSSTLPELSLISINMTREQAEKNQEVFDELSKNATSPTLKVGYGNCTKLYEVIIHKTEEAYRLCKQGRYKEVGHLGEALSLVYKCENHLPLSSNTSAPYTQTMILTCQTSAYVVRFTSEYGTYPPTP